MGRYGQYGGVRRMPSWIVRGVDRQTPEPVVRLIDAANPAEVNARADDQGLVVLDISRAPRGKLVTAEGDLDLNRFRAATWIQSVVNAIR